MISKERHGPWALIVGGSEGIGEALAIKLGELGIHVVLVARKAGPLEETAARVRATGAQVRTLSLDISREDAPERIREITDGLEIGLLVHNVGGSAGGGPFVDQALDATLGVVRINCTGLVRMAHHYARRMKDRGSGGILIFGSMAGNVGGANLATYSAAKAFSQIFAEALWAELEPYGVDVLDLVIGSADTPSRRRSGARDSDSFPVARPEDVARQAIDRIGDGPVLVPPGNEEMFQMLNAMPRREAASMIRGLLTQMKVE
ncbi:SDR family NAD(P)-dependent oxidoreductase [Novosphingobium album (ex Liu et al. 2023)]|uniref:SDR family NAD(P)-dependent oxidoreductase n=1 Tax=Novosphingobium album (ex Liu et al. 2023) TaxID=3031130 RepID=A0ABT5WJB3_9SPHN|nr:SDR family NAD(P)-dependent oxidoreductase [Novosphingobium album (ex Liu et al. 2023)]MDE8650130.1 SDR family NAD(P)-dependent oxidoreductase [Novosphingobium album (ex Liu et al. 2023)]